MKERICTSKYMWDVSMLPVIPGLKQSTKHARTAVDPPSSLKGTAVVVVSPSRPAPSPA